MPYDFKTQIKYRRLLKIKPQKLNDEISFVLYPLF